MKTKYQIVAFTTLAAACGFMVVRAKQADRTPPPLTTAQIEARGEYLVRLGGCTDCHTPKIMTDRGPADDVSRFLSGHPAATVISAPQLEPGGAWEAATAGMTAWTGPWGVSFSSNLTPDQATGIGAWTKSDFIKTMRTGKHKGEGRAILPPMPWQPLSEATEDDLTAIFTYLQSLPAVSNKVPEPVAPAKNP